MKAEELNFRMKELFLSFVGALTILFAPVTSLMFLIGGFIILDTVVAIIRVIIVKQQFTSFKLSRLIFKMFFYQSTILMLFLVDKFLLGHSILGYDYFITKVGSLILIFIECLSIDESIRIINKGKGFSYYFYKLVNTIKKGKEVFIDIKKNLK